MKEISITLPIAAGQQAHKWVQSELMAAYGGWTAVEVQGAWADDDGKVHCERSRRYMVGVEDTSLSDWALVRILSGLFGRCSEQSIYVVGRDGAAQLFERDAFDRREVAA